MDANQALREFGDFVSSLDEDSRGLMYCDISALQESFSVLSNTIDALRRQTQWQPMETCPSAEDDEFLGLLRKPYNKAITVIVVSHDGYYLPDLQDGMRLTGDDLYGWMPLPEVE